MVHFEANKSVVQQNECSVMLSFTRSSGTVTGGQSSVSRHFLLTGDTEDHTLDTGNGPYGVWPVPAGPSPRRAGSG